MKIQIVDLFCGVGGLTRGLINSGFDVVAGFDIDKTCEYTYSFNNHVPFHNKNIREVTGKEILSCYDKDSLKILVGCAPCQPFSQMRFKMGKKNTDDEKYDLLNEFGRLIKEVQPDIISMENVPSIRNTAVFSNFLKVLKNNGYHTDGGNVVYCPDYGIPQNRRRFVLLASKLGDIHLLPPTHDKNNVTVRQYIGNLPELEAGQTDPNDSMHHSASLSPLNLQRIRASRPGGTWRDWPEELRCACHRRNSGKTYASVYGRMKWDAIGPTITTQFYAYGTGRYGHPEQDRALSLREGALLQTFPMDYSFINPDIPFCMSDVARHIGNAVPVRLGEIIGSTIINHIKFDGGFCYGRR